VDRIKSKIEEAVLSVEIQQVLKHGFLWYRILKFEPIWNSCMGVVLQERLHLSWELWAFVMCATCRALPSA
jgi:hypothetical protein